MRRFKLKRDTDVSGVSGIGYVAEGCLFKNGKCVLVWYSDHSSINMYESIEDLLFVHGHGNMTHVEFIDPEGTD